MEIASRVRFLVLAACLGLIWIAIPAGRVAKAQESDRKSAASAPAGAGATARRRRGGRRIVGDRTGGDSRG